MSESSDSVVEHPDVRLEDVRKNMHGNECTGRGGRTAAPRGYNAERPAEAVLNARRWFFSTHLGEEFDNYIIESKLRVECKSCVNRYPTGPYGRFRIWWNNHKKLLSIAEYSSPDSCLYFFVVYTVEEDIEKEIGKPIVPVRQVDEIIDRWTVRDHDSVGKEPARDISWNALLGSLGISHERFKTENIIDLTVNDK